MDRSFFKTFQIAALVLVSATAWSMDSSLHPSALHIKKIIDQTNEKIASGQIIFDADELQDLYKQAYVWVWHLIIEKRWLDLKHLVDNDILSPDFEVENSKDQSRCTRLLHAVVKEQFPADIRSIIDADQLISALFAKGARLEDKDKDGKTVLDLAPDLTTRRLLLNRANGLSLQLDDDELLALIDQDLENFLSNEIPDFAND